MSFSVRIEECTEWCDHCKKPGTTERPMMILHANSREGGRHLIWVHLDHIEKEIAKFKAQPKEQAPAA